MFILVRALTLIRLLLFIALFISVVVVMVSDFEGAHKVILSILDAANDFGLVEILICCTYIALALIVGIPSSLATLEHQE